MAATTGATQTQTNTRYVVEPCLGGYHVRDTEFIGPGSIFDGPVKCVMSTREAAERYVFTLQGCESPTCYSRRMVRNQRGNYVLARRLELLSNGKWRVDYVSGLVELFDCEPVHVEV